MGACDRLTRNGSTNWTPEHSFESSATFDRMDGLRQHLHVALRQTSDFSALHIQRATQACHRTLLRILQPASAAASESAASASHAPRSRQHHDEAVQRLREHYGSMGLITNILAVVLTISFLTFIAFFGRLPVFRRTPIGFAHRTIWVHIPKVLGRVDKVLTGGRASRWATGGWDRLVYGKHPVVLIFFLGLVTGGATLFLPSTWPHLTLVQQITVCLLVAQPYVWTYLCNQSNASSPHIITAENHADNMTAYPYDYKLFHPNVICRTCNFIKPARSKHCSLCKACVARSDHHCIWVNNCLGRGNYKYFIGLLSGTTLLLAYGSWVAYNTLKPEVDKHWAEFPTYHSPQPGTQEFALHTKGQAYWETLFARAEYYLDILATALLAGGVGRGGVGLLCFLTWPLPFTLLIYHMYLIWAGATTNESGKWSDWKEDIADNLAFITDVREDSESAAVEEPQTPGKRRHQHSYSEPLLSPGLPPNIQSFPSHAHGNNLDFGDAQQQDAWPSYQPPQTTFFGLHNGGSGLPQVPESPSVPNPGVNDSSWRWSPWPKRSTQFMVLTNDGHTPRLLAPHITRVVGKEPAWRRLRSLKDVDNTYDLGFFGNLKDLLLN